MRKWSPTDAHWLVHGAKQDLGFLSTESLPLPDPEGSSSTGGRAQGVVAPEGAWVAVWWQAWGALCGTQWHTLPSPTALLAVRTLELRSPRRLPLCLSFASLMKKLRALPIISLSNTENSHNCHSPYFSKCKNKVKNVLLFQGICSQNIQWLERAVPFGRGCWTTLRLGLRCSEGHGNSWCSAFCFHSFAPTPVPKAIGRAWLDPDS